jgi:predicted amidohydrolase YtcJ
MLVILNANIYTAADAAPRARAMAVGGGVVRAIGDEATVRAFIGPKTRVVDLGGQTLLPGLIDSHGHMLSLGTRLSDVDVTGTTSYEQVIAKVAERAKSTPKGQWILGRGWDQNDWAVMAMPSHGPLTRAVPDHPVRITRIDGHAALVNQMALDLAHITRNTPDPAGGAILKDAKGEPTGVLLDAATGLVSAVIPPITQPEREQRLLLAMQECARLGLTMVHDAGISTQEWLAYKTLLAKGTFPIRVYAMAAARDSLADTLLAHGGVKGLKLSLRAIKVVSDGALGSRGALLGAPYSDDPHNLGLATFPLARLAELGEQAFQKDLQVRVHAIGDSANHGTLDAFEHVFGGRPQPRARWAIEHAQIVRPADVARFARLGVVASMQPTHATSDGPWAESRLGPERVRWGYRWRDFMNAGVPVASGSDFPVESPDPMLGLYAAITRRDLDGKLPAGGWFPDQRMTPAEALKSFTATGAWLAFREEDLGTLEVGKQADFVVVDHDVIGGDPEQIPRSKVVWTVVGGQTVYEKPAAMAQAAPGLEAFQALARSAQCADQRNRLFLIDDRLVFWDRAGGCYDARFAQVLYAGTVDSVLCSYRDSFAGHQKVCPVSGYSKLFETILANLRKPDLGLGRAHTVKPIPY